ncbi:alpha-amylase family glycosyl hydrolase [Sediminivirga luteola]|uniref:alpha-amylase family glycosyl hydrolase n=1 Tax=Sediminivirga luteola TaxID=1774748 RepID=UPI001F56A751|nr:alpha-amylase family glycosyl hydrolase [Sediminivirga luteola]MCI2266096.1 malto-oligosyltrehalose synthase [Sediminivirga luteola]
MAPTRPPMSTYRLQITPDFTLYDAVEAVPYLARLGAGAVYLSPILTAASGSAHGYDVVDPTRVDPARGGEEGLRTLSSAAHAAGMRVIADLVPNHMGVADPQENSWWWDVLRHGRESAYAGFFDIDWDAGDGRIVLPVLGSAEDLAAVTVDAGAGVLRYYEHAFPLAPGTLGPTHGSQELSAVLAAQHYTLVSWREDHRLNYRRFFAVKELAGLRVEEPAVFDAAHAEVARWFTEGLVDGVRIDHPDGLADPRGYLERLAELTGGAWTLVEKITEPGEALPDDWAAHGTTGYEVIRAIDGYLAGSGAAGAFAALTPEAEFDEVALTAKRELAATALRAEFLRLTRLAEAHLPSGIAHGRPNAGVVAGAQHGTPSADSRAHGSREASAASEGADAPRADLLAEALREITVQFHVYRSYAGQPQDELDAAMTRAGHARPDLIGLVDALAPLLREDDHALAVRFRQTTGAVMAKGVEDTAFYRYARLTSLNEVGGQPDGFPSEETGHPDGSHAAAKGSAGAGHQGDAARSGQSGRAGMSGDAARFHALMAERAQTTPWAMSALTTHDTKRSEDTRARITVLAECPEDFARLLACARQTAPLPDAPELEVLLWQAIIGAWEPATSTGGAHAQLATKTGPPADLRERLHAYALKAAREQAWHTAWTDPHEQFETALRRAVDLTFDDPGLRAEIDRLDGLIRRPAEQLSLTAKTLQLMAPGVPDVYQGTELRDQSLVDPDNRRPVDFQRLAGLLAALDGPGETFDQAKLHLTSTLLRLRNRHPDLLEPGSYTPLELRDPRLIGFARGEDIVVLASRFPVRTAREGWNGATLHSEIVPGPVSSPGLDPGDAALVPAATMPVATGSLLAEPHAWTEVLTGSAPLQDGRLSSVFARYPVAVFERSRS